MSQNSSLTFSKEEHLCSRKLIERLFGGGESKSMTSFPLRLVYMSIEAQQNASLIQVLISVPKKHFKRAVKRNRVKRQLREAYRKNKSILYEAIAKRENFGLALALIWIDDKLYSSQEVEKSVLNLLRRISEKIDAL